MIGLASILGFVIGVAIGALAAASTGSELRADAQKWISDRRWESYRSRETWKFPTLLQTILNLSRTEFLVLLACGWIVGLLCVAVLEPMWGQGSSALSYLVGSIVGAAASPWIWLHFTRNFGQAEVTAESGQPKSEPGKQGEDDTKKKEDKEKEEGESDQFARYRFVTYMLAAALLVTVLLPHLTRLLPRTSSFGALGVSFAFVPRGDAARSDFGTPILNVAAPSGQSTANTARRLSSATTAAHRVASGERSKGKQDGERKKLADVKSSLEGFLDLSMMDRDKVYVAYLLHEQAVRRNTSKTPSQFENLQEYVEQFKFKHDPDAKFLESLAGLSECVARYAEEIRDFRLFFVDSNNFLRALMVGVAAQWGPETNTPGSAIIPGKTTTPGKTRAARKANSKLKLDPFPQQIVEALAHIHAGDLSKPCANEADLTTPVQPATWQGVGATPYPAYQIAHYLAAIDSVESGVLVLQDWLAYQKNQVKTQDPEQAWYTVRAMLAASQLPYRYGSVSPTHAALVQFQQVTTDRIGALLGLRGPQTWRALCAKLAQTGLHAQIGRYLAWTYADERNYLFELLLPEDFGLPRDRSLKTVNVSPATFLEEAEAMIKTPDCFAGVPRFNDPKANQKLVALFHLNAAQLRYAVRAATRGAEEKAALTKRIAIDLERAKPLETQEELTVDDLDLLRPAGEFDRHRARLARLLKVLDSEAERD